MSNKVKFTGALPWVSVFANSLDPWNPELWARESIEILYESWIYGGLVHRGFDKDVAKFGDLVHTRKPAEFESEPWQKGDSVVYQDATANDVQVKLDQIADVSFQINDVEATYSFADLVREYIRPAAAALARKVDLKLAGQAVQFLGNTVGGMGTGSSANIHSNLVDVEKAMNDLKMSDANRNLVMTSGTKADGLKEKLFVGVDQSGTSSALRRAFLGDLFGLNNYMSLNAPSVINTDTETAQTVSGATAAGATSLTSSGTITAGMYFTVAGDMTPLKKLSGATTAVNMNRPLREAVADSAPITIYSLGAVDNGAGYAAGWVKKIHVDGGPTPHVGQIVSFGATSTDEYMITRVTNTAGSDYDIELDRALVSALSDDDIVCYGPTGSLNLAFQPAGIALVNRPLQLPETNNSQIAVASDGNISLRVAMSWDQDTKSKKISLDALFGIKTLDTQYGVVLLS